MQIVDAQVHIWAADTPERSWPPGRANQAHKPVPFTADDLLAEMDAAGVARAVLVPPSWEGDRNDVSIEAAQRHPDRFAVMGRLAAENPANAALIPTWKQQPGMLGLRFTFHTELMGPWLSDGTADWIWPAAEAADVPLMILPPDQLPAVDRIAERHPGLRLVIDHMARRTGRKDADAFTDLPDLLRLARHPNVAVKASCLMAYSAGTYPWPALHDYIRQTVDAFGPQRVFWGSDMTRIPCTYREAVTFFTEELPFLSAEDLDWIMGRGLCRWLGWPLSDDAR